MRFAKIQRRVPGVFAVVLLAAAAVAGSRQEKAARSLRPKNQDRPKWSA